MGIRGATRMLAAATWTAATVSPAGSQTPPVLRPGDIVAASIGDNSVSVFDGATGSFRGYVVAPSGDGEPRNPTGVAFGPDGHLYVAASGSARILRFDGSTGAPLGVFAEGGTLERPFSLVFDGGGDLLVSSGAAVLRYGPDGAFRGYAARDSALVQPIGLAVGSDGLLYVVNSTAPSVDRFDPRTGRRVDVFLRDSLAFPSDVAFGPDGDLYVSNASAHRVVRFDGRSGSFVQVVAALPDGGVPMGLAFSPDGRLLIGDFGAGRLFRLDRTGRGDGTLRLLSSEGLVRPENIAVKPGPMAPGAR